MVLKTIFGKPALCLAMGSAIFSVKPFARSHFAGGSFNPNDYFIPANPGWVFPLYYGFTNFNFYDAKGNKTNVIQINQNPPVTPEMGQTLKTHSVIPMMIYSGKGKILDTRWGF